MTQTGSAVLDDATLARIREAFASPDLTIGRGPGNATGGPGAGVRCTIAEINLILTGELTDGPHPCVSEVIRQWVIRVQDAMPAELRNAPEWRAAAAGIAGSAGTPADEWARRAVVLDWMWDALGDEAVLSAVPASARPAWDAMLRERSAEAAYAAYAGVGGAAYAAYAACATDAAYAAAAAAYAAAHAAAYAYWRRRNPAALLARLIETRG
jgi:hypothetical protein